MRPVEKNGSMRQCISAHIIKSFCLVGLIAPWVVHHSAVHASAKAKDIIKQADLSRMPEGDLTFQVKVEDFKGKSKLRETLYAVSAKGGTDSLIETIAPARQKGRKLLMKDDDLWFFTPDLKRPTRVSMQQRLTGEVANGDLARTNFAGDYEAKLVGEVKIGKGRAYHLSLTANRSGVTYSRVEYWVSADRSYLPLKAEFYATSGKLLKRATYGGIKNVLGRKRVTRMIIEDAVKKISRSELTYLQFRSVSLDSSMFNKDAMAD